MRIAIDIRHLGTPHITGIGRYTIETIQALANLYPKDSFLLFASGSSKIQKFLPTFSQRNIDLTYLRMPNRMLSGLLVTKQRTLESFLPSQPDLWWFPNINILHTHLPYTLTLHDLSFMHFPSFFTAKDRLWHAVANVPALAKQATTITTVSTTTKNDISTQLRIPKDQIIPTPLGVDPRFHPRQEPADRSTLRNYGLQPKTYLLSLCTREPRKNLESVIDGYEAWMKTADKNHQADLVLAGNAGWKSAHIKQRINTSPFHNRIKQIGYVPQKHIPALYRHARVFIFPSYYEGYGLPAMEAAACKTPVIASYTSSLPEVLQEQALFIDPFNKSDIALALNQQIPPPNIQPPTWEETARKTYRAFLKTFQSPTD